MHRSIAAAALTGIALLSGSAASAPPDIPFVTETVPLDDPDAPGRRNFIDFAELEHRFPLSPAYDKLIDSQIADMKNVGPRMGGSITAAQYLQRFVEEGTPWAHLDIAGMVWADKPGATWDKGATGFGVRLIDRYVRDKLES